MLDLSRMLPGAVVARQLLDLGARVIKVEDPDGGEGVDTVLRRAATSDVLVESFRPGTLERWGLAPQDLLADHPGLIGCSLPAFADRPDRVAHDLNLTAEAGVLDLVSGDGVPAIQLADVGAGLLATTAILAALLDRERGGGGGWIRQPLESGTRPFMTWATAEAALGRERVAAMLLGGACPCYRTYRCGDGRRLAVAALEPKFWIGFVTAIGADNMAVEVLPGEDAPAVQMPVHQHCLVEAGVYLIENLFLSPLAAAGIVEFCFILLPVKFKGATGSPARPIALI